MGQPVSLNEHEELNRNVHTKTCMYRDMDMEIHYIIKLVGFRALGLEPPIEVVSFGGLHYQAYLGLEDCVPVGFPGALYSGHPKLHKPRKP